MLICRNEPYGNSRNLDKLFGDSDRKSSSYDNLGGAGVTRISPEPSRPVHTMFGGAAPTDGGAAPAAAPSRSRARRAEPEDDSAVKKFGSAKAISSAQFFGEQRVVTLQEGRWERDSNLSRFQGSNSISSAEYFGGEAGGAGARGARAFSVGAPDLDDVRESVRAGVTRVAGRLSSLANGVVSSIQERYGY
ncbi:hypothetical protein HF086_000284 [Spodoptera exigua]|uniref:Uncharacterized protein n=1 Tax=Spodoptera exigua TaxID=7107 RepID=A0A922M7Q0_SPOEX|nr:hypothetical protein HF086_000284 [Spodoptera exigua]